MNQLLHDNKMLKVLRVFFDDPIHNFQLREISREIRIHHKTVLKFIRQLLKSQLIKANKTGIYTSYNANTQNPAFQEYKKAINQINLYESGLIKYISDKIMPETIILFGGYSKGTDAKTSDIDLFIESKEEKLELEKFEVVLGRKIHPLFEINIKNLNKELLNNIINGIIVYGYVRIFK